MFHKSHLGLLLVFLYCSLHSQIVEVIDNKGTIKSIDNSKWAQSGTDIHNKNSGKVGIGNTSPTTTLEVSGKPTITTEADGIMIPKLSGNQLKAKNTQYTSAQTGTIVYVTSADTSPAGQTINVTDAGFYFYDGSAWQSGSASSATNNLWSILGNSGTLPATNFIGTTDAQDLVFRTNNTEKTRILSNGNAGIGTNNPTQKFEVAGSMYQNFENSAFVVDEGGKSRLGIVKKVGSNPFIAAGNNQPIIFSQLSSFSQTNIFGNIGSSFTERMRIDGSGNVGIGGGVPSNLLHLSGITDFPAGNLLRYIQISNFNTGNTTSDGTIIGINATGEMQINNREAQPIVFSTTNSEKMRINANGNVGIGSGLTPISRLNVRETGSKTVNTTGTILENLATSSITSINKTGLSIISTGNWNGASAINNGLNVTVSGGTTNYAAIFSGGNVGIGTPSPTALLDVNGMARIRSLPTGDASDVFVTADTDGNLRAIAASDLNTANIYNTDDTLTGTRIVTQNDNQLLFNTGTSTIQIGDDATIGPAYGRLQIRREANQPDNQHHLAFVRSGNRVAGMGFIDNSDTIGIINSSNNTDLRGIFLTSVGNVGIGINNPAQKLHVAGDFRLTGGIYDSTGDVGTAGQILTSTGSLVDWVSPNSFGWGLTGNSGTNPATNFIGTTDNQDLVIRSNNTEKLRLFSLVTNPYVGIGRITLTGVNGGASTFSGPTLFFGDLGNISSNTGMDFIIDDDNNATNTRFSFKANGDGAAGTVELMQINETGNVGIGLPSGTASAKLHTVGTVRLEGLGTNTINTNVLTTDVNGNVTNKVLSNIVTGSSSNVATNALTLDTGATNAVLGNADATLTVNNTAPLWNANQLQGNDVSNVPPTTEGQLLTWDDTNSNWEPRTSVINNLAEIYFDSGTPLALSNLFQDLTFLSNGIVDSDFTTTTTSITVANAGRYEITYRATVQISSGNRTGAEFFLDIDGAESPGTRSYTYNSDSIDTVTTIKILDLDAGAVVKVQGRIYDGNGNLDVINGSSLIVKRIK